MARPIRSSSHRASQTNYEDEMDLDDLHDPEGNLGIILEMRDRERYFEGRSTASSNGAADHQVSRLHPIITVFIDKNHIFP